MVLEDYEIQQNMVDVEFSYLPFDLSVDSPPVVMMNDRQVKNFVAYWRMKNNIRLCVTFKATVNDRRNIDLNKEPSDSSEGGVDVLLHEKLPKFVSKAKPNDSNFITSKDAEVGARSMMVDSMVKKGQYFKSKEALKASLEIFAMKYNFDYRVTKSGTRFWCIRCIDNVCKWRVRAECLERTPSARTIGNLIKHNYEGVNEGPKPNDIINIMRTENGCELTYSQAWESREYAVNEVRGIPEKSFAKIPNYLHMLKEVNPGTHTNYDVDCDGRFKYLFISFGQSIRGFNKKIRKVIVVDGTFLKNKYEGVLLVATAVDGNSNLYPIAFGIADSENDSSWEWFLMQVKVVIADDKDLAFVSDRHISIGKMIGKIYPLAKHGICIHHLIGNVVTNYKGRGVAGRLAKASKAYRVAEFDKHFAEICNISPAIGGYLQEADVKKWARCHFLGYRYDINTNNPAESINSALRSPREYLIIHLLDSIREMLTRWFYERRALSEQQNGPLTIEVEKKISRRIEKGEKFKDYLIFQFIL
ncbi:PREDICTED: uncharacterized protein LOC104789175 [Camelina sativa]|uniref:Uncharacterized protein LOC104789175 n=1 Tax=Camelina sativa TaxID=90675 RepID=A0ABM0ZBE4_CAMSA|nr:PREDICTED: uncharacterized protein LOC104789175 [Camelina sativa]